MREDRPLLELEVLPAVGVLHDDVGPDDIGRHQVGRELDPREGQLEALGQRLDEQGLAEARHALQEHVAPGEHADQHVVDDLPVPDDDFLDLGTQRLERGNKVPYAGVLGHRDSSLLGMTTRRAIEPNRSVIASPL